MRKRVPGYITTEKSNDFGMDVSVQRQMHTDRESPPSGDPVPEGSYPNGANLSGDRRFRNVIPPGEIGSSAGNDLDVLTPPQYEDTVPYDRAEFRDPRMHSAYTSLTVGAKTQVPFQDYGSFTPRRAPMPRAAQDQVYLEGYGENAADPRMTDENASAGLLPTDLPDRAPLYGDNRDGVLHNNPGYAAKVNAINLASPAVKNMNPTPKKVKG